MCVCVCVCVFVCVGMLYVCMYEKQLMSESGK